MKVFVKEIKGFKNLNCVVDGKNVVGDWLGQINQHLEHHYCSDGVFYSMSLKFFNFAKEFTKKYGKILNDYAKKCKKIKDQDFAEKLTEVMLSDVENLTEALIEKHEIEEC